MPTDLRQLHEEFLAEQRYVSRLAPTTLLDYGATFALFMAVMPNATIDRLTPAFITEFFRRLNSRPRQTGRTERRGVRASTVASHRSRLGRFLSWLTARGLLTSNPIAAIPYPRVSYDTRQYLGRAAVDRILASVLISSDAGRRFHRTRNLALFLTLLYTGIRRGELLGLRVADLGMDCDDLQVRAETSKSRQSRTLPINAALRRALSDYLIERPKGPLVGDRLFVTEDGNALSLHGLKHLVQAVIRRSGVRFHLHQFRHTFAINYLHQTGDIAKLKQLLGHSDIRMTSSYLRHIPTRAMREGVEAVRLEALL